MDGRRFLELARQLVQESTEECWRTAASRAYYGLFHEAGSALIRWGFIKHLPFQAHAFVRTRFAHSRHTDLRTIGDALNDLIHLRHEADYEIMQAGRFYSSFVIEQAIIAGEDALELLDQIDADPAERSAAVAAIRAVP